MMSGFIDKIHLKEKAEEDLYFAKLDRKLIQAMHNKQATNAIAKDKNKLSDIRLDEDKH